MILPRVLTKSSQTSFYMGLHYFLNRLDVKLEELISNQEVSMMTDELAAEGKDLIELEDAEREAMAVIRRRIHSKIKNLFIEASDLKQTGDLATYDIKGRLGMVITPKGIFKKEKVEERDFKIVIDASTGKCIGARV